MEFVFESVENSIFSLDVLNFQLNALKEVNLNVRWEMKKYLCLTKETYHGRVWDGVVYSIVECDSGLRLRQNAK